MITIILLFFLSTIQGFILPQFVREWHPIGIENQIDRSKPFVFNIGKLPMVLWYDKNDPIATLNICKHLGAKLDNAIINNGCLHCSNHLTGYNQTDALGKVISKNGMLWWSFKSYTRNPISNFKKEEKKLDIHHIDINVNLLNVILEFVHSNNKIKARARKNKFLFYEKLFNAEHRFYYKYPYYLKGSINNKINYTINFLPLEENKTRLFITIANNIDAKVFMNYFLNAKLNNLNNYDNNTTNLKYMIMFKEHNDYIKKVYMLFDKYSFPNEFTISCFYKYRQFY
jgi:nitrite reductase/ring-hydroxylating ferredoxin subunit